MEKSSQPINESRDNKIREGMRVLIVGAGPTGLTAALEFARQGIIPEIVDAKEGPSELSRAVGILPESIDKLRASGAGDEILKEAIKIKKIKIHYNNSVLVNLDLSKISNVEELIYSLPQDRTESIMSAVLEKLGARVEYDRKVVDISTNDKEASVTFSSGECKTYDWIIGADGIKSTVREKLGIQYAGYDLPETWSIADIELEEDYNPDSFFAWILKGIENDIAIMVPIGSRRARIVSSTPDCIETLPISLKIKNVRRAGTFKIPVRQADTYVQGRVLLAGDSAHTHSPVGGRGMNLGIDDAVEAVKAILENKTDKYSNERQKIGARIIRDTEKVRKALVSRNPLANMLIKTLFFFVRNIHPIRKMLIRNITRL